MISGRFALAFANGMVAAVNPCGFAMLPAYLAFFLGLEGDDTRPTAVEGGERDLRRAVTVSAVLTLGFVIVFGLVGAIVSNFSSTVIEYASYVTVVIGVALVALGIAMLCGFQPSVSLPKLDKGAGSRELGSVLLFGISYAIASLGCTMPLFLATVASTFTGESYASGVATFVLYSVGMGLVITFLTVAIALAHKGVVLRMRQALPYVHLASAALLLVMGAYLAYYGWYEIRVRGGNLGRDPIVDFFQRRQSALSAWINDVGAIRLGVLMAVLVVVALGVAVRQGRRRPTRETSPKPEMEDGARP
jgi:cytochrome c-type biogenesis protein